MRRKSIVHTKAADIVGSDGTWLKSYTVGGVRYYTRSSITWGSMNTRCVVDGPTWKSQPTYVGCSISINFKDYQYFTDWYTKQVGYDCVDYHLDKDILLPGNKVYSEEVCVLVPPQLNTFSNSHKGQRGPCPQGATFHKRDQLYEAKVQTGSGRRFLGRYRTAEAASKAYVEAKYEEAARWYERLRDGEFIVDERVIEAMRLWQIT